MQVNDKVILMANKEEGWPQEIGVITAVQDQKQFPGMYLVQVIETPLEMDDSDDGIREIHEDFIIPYPTGRKERDIRKMYDFAGIHGRGFRIASRQHGKNTMRNYFIQADAARRLNFAIQSNYAEIEKLVFASHVKCGNDCPFLKLLFGDENDKTKTK